MLSVSDTSPLTGLIQIGQAELLPRLFGRIVVPPAVHSELSQIHPVLPSWLEVLDPGPISVSLQSSGLHRGETEGIALALRLKASVLLIDEQHGRQVALAHGLRITGLLGILILAKSRGLVPVVEPLIRELRSTAGCRFADALVAQVLREVGE